MRLELPKKKLIIYVNENKITDTRGSGSIYIIDISYFCKSHLTI